MSSNHSPHDVPCVRARDGGSFDQWNWRGESGGLLQLNDNTDSSWDLPLPSSFEEMCILYQNAFVKLLPTGRERLELPAGNPLDARIVQIR